MGREIKTTLRIDGRIHEGTASLEGGAFVFEGGVTLTLPFAEIFSVEASGGFLDLKTSRGLVMVELGERAEAWAERIKNPGAFLAKLGVDATKKVALLGKLDDGLKGDLEGSGAKLAKTAKSTTGKTDFDVVFLGVAAKADLEKVPAARAMMKDEGALWIVYPKAPDDVLRERDVIIAGRTLQLNDGKPVKLEPELSAIRFVVPPGARKKKG